jgi:hypothetical protein
METRNQAAKNRSNSAPRETRGHGETGGNIEREQRFGHQGSSNDPNLRDHQSQGQYPSGSRNVSPGSADKLSDVGRSSNAGRSDLRNVRDLGARGTTFSPGGA